VSMLDPQLNSALAAGAARAESRMTETVVAGTEIETVDPDSLQTIVTIDAIYSGTAQVKYPTLTASDRQAGGQQVSDLSLVVKLPTKSVILPKNTIIKPTGSTVDESLVGRRYRVTGAPQSGQVTSHRYPVEELS
jgi:hypothetical protein